MVVVLPDAIRIEEQHGVSILAEAIMAEYEIGRTEEAAVAPTHQAISSAAGIDTTSIV